jgi:hypothetical protein
MKILQIPSGNTTFSKTSKTNANNVATTTGAKNRIMYLRVPQIHITENIIGLVAK